jgi:hypothetical protein
MDRMKHTKYQIYNKNLGAPFSEFNTATFASRVYRIRTRDRVR